MPGSPHYSAAAHAAPQPAGVGDERPLCVIAFRKGEREPELISWDRMPVGEYRLYSDAQNSGFLIDTDDGTEWVEEDPRRSGIPEHFENLRALTLQAAKDEMLSAWEVRAELEAALRTPSREPEGGAVDERLKWFLKVIEGAGGEVCSTESRHNPINVFCEDRDKGDDTFNISEAAGYTQTSHDTSFDTSTTRITDKGRAYLAALATREEAPERRECDECGFKGTSDDRNKEQDYCTACGGNSPAGGPDECAHCGAKNHMVMACQKCGGRFSLDEDAGEEAPAEAGATKQLDRLFYAGGEYVRADEAGGHVNHSGDATDMVDHAELARLAEAATKGPWHRGNNDNGSSQGEMSVWPDPQMRGGIIARCGWQMPWDGWHEQPAKDAAFIAAANPATVLALLAENAALRAERDQVAGESIWWKGVIGDGSHQPSGEVRSVKHLHPAMVKPIYEANKGTAVADVIAGLIFSLAINQNREQFLVADANERRTEAERKLAEAEEVGLSIYIYANDTLSGRVDGPDDRAWQRAAVVEIRNRARVFRSKDADRDKP